MLEEVARMKPRQGFGELALITRARRSATIRCATRCALMAISREDYQQIMAGRAALEMQQKLSFMEGVASFRGWQRPALLALSYFLKPLQAARGAALIREGEPADTVYFVESGECRVVIRGMPVGTLLPGQTFGELDCLNPNSHGGAYTSSVVVNAPARLYAMTADAFRTKLPFATVDAVREVARLRQTFFESRVEAISRVRRETSASAEKIAATLQYSLPALTGAGGVLGNKNDVGNHRLPRISGVGGGGMAIRGSMRKNDRASAGAHGRVLPLSERSAAGGAYASQSVASRGNGDAVAFAAVAGAAAMVRSAAFEHALYIAARGRAPRRSATGHKPLERASPMMGAALSPAAAVAKAAAAAARGGNQKRKPNRRGGDYIPASTHRAARLPPLRREPRHFRAGFVVGDGGLPGETAGAGTGAQAQASPSQPQLRRLAAVDRAARASASGGGDGGDRRGGQPRGLTLTPRTPALSTRRRAALKCSDGAASPRSVSGGALALDALGRGNRLSALARLKHSLGGENREAIFKMLRTQ